MEVKEFEIPVPWGHIAVKAWGKEEYTPVLALHGIVDNAGTFDHLIPQLPTSFYFLCVDFPGHGKSKHLPPHLSISTVDLLFSVKFVVDYLNRKKYIFMGHSTGAQIAISFAQLFPEYVIQILALDTIFFNTVNSNKTVPFFRKKVESIIEICDNIKKIEEKRYQYNEAKSKFINDRSFTNVSEDAADAMLKRCLIYLNEGTVKFANDPRLPAITNLVFDPQFSSELFANYPIRCPILLIITEESKKFFSLQKKALDQIKKQSNQCLINYVEGGHYVHINNPENIAPVICKFLKYKKYKL